MKPPFHAPLPPAALLVAGALAGAVAMAVFRPAPEGSVVRVTLPPQTQIERSPTPTPKTLPEETPDAGSTLLDRAASGDLDALKILETRDEHERAAEDARAIATGRVALARRDLAALSAAIEAAPDLAHDRATLARFFDFVDKEPLMIDALIAVSRLPGPESLDLLDAVWQAQRSSTAGLLARDLTRGPAREQASEALSIKLDLETLTEAQPPDDTRVAARCEKTRELLARVETSGDRRLAPLFARLDERVGCGSNRQGDCYACLREEPRLARAKEAAMRREVETPWILRRR